MAKSMLEDWDSEIENILWFLLWLRALFFVFVGGILYIHTHTHTHTHVCVCMYVSHPATLGRLTAYTIEKK
jgi:hypothetical protein